MLETLSPGASGPVVQLLQKALLQSGAYSLQADGIFGPYTKEAVHLFQSTWGLTPDGVVGPLTWKALWPSLLSTRIAPVLSGDTLFSVARRHGVTVSELLAANPLITSPNTLIPGTPLTIPLPGSAVLSDISYSSVVLAVGVEALRARYSFLNVGMLGLSVLGRAIPCLRFGRGPLAVVYNASHHANEWITTPLLMRFLERLCQTALHRENIGDADAAALYDRITLFIVPMVNPDGVDLVTGQLGPGSAGYQRAYAMRGSLPFPASWKANIRGVDLNNNYPALWEQGRALKEQLGLDNPGPRDYVGPFPLSEPESALMAQLTKAVQPRLTISLHTQGREIYWSFNDIFPPDGRRIGERMAAASGYLLSDPSGPSFGGYKDWYIQEWNLPGYTVEAGSGVNPLPIGDFDEIYPEVEAILTIGLTAAARNDLAHG